MEHELFEITQGAVIKNSDGAILLLEMPSGKWHLPGGRIDKGEHWAGALRRELKEELGLEDFEIKKLLSYDTWLHDGRAKCGVNFLVEAKDFSEPRLSNEHKSCAWVKSADLDNLNIYSDGLRERLKSFYAL